MIKLTPCSKERLNDMKKLYYTAFPAEERAPWRLLVKRAGQHRAELLAATDGGSFAGMVYLVTMNDMAYLFYLAVEENMRGRGIGGQILTALKEKYPGKRLFIAREQLDKAADNYPQRESRRRFYLANGFEDWSGQIIEGTMVYDIMGVGRPVTPPEYNALMKSWAGWFKSLFFRAHMVE